MPGLQSIVSAWTKINHDHVEYFDEKHGVHPQQAQTRNGGGPGGVPLEGNIDNGNLVAGGGYGGGIGSVIDPRLPQPSLPSSSSLSSFSFSKGIPHHSLGGGTADTHSLTVTAPTISQRSSVSGGPVGANNTAPHNNNLAPPSHRYPLHRHNGGQPQLLNHQGLPSQPQLSGQHRSPRHDGTSLLVATHAPNSAMHAASLSSSSRSLHRPSRRASHGVAGHHHANGGIHHGHHSHHSGGGSSVGSGLHSQLESYNGNNNNSSSSSSNHHHHHHGGSNSSNQRMDSFPPPQAGADAILGRRKSTATNNGINNNNNNNINPNGPLTMADRGKSMPLGDPPASLSSSNSTTGASNLAATRSRGGGHGSSASALNRSPSTSLWHSNKSSASSSGGNNSGGESSSKSVTASLVKMNNSSFGVLGGPVSNAATIAELNSQAENALQSMNNLSLKQQQGMTLLSASNNTPQHSNIKTDINATGASQTNISNTNPQSSQTTAIGTTTTPMAIPQPRATTKRGFGSRQKLRKSHSRTDLVREMALDRRGYPRNKRGSAAGGVAAMVRNSSTSDELDNSNHSHSHPLLQQQRLSQKDLTLMRPQQRTPEFLEETNQSVGGMMRSASGSSMASHASGRSRMSQRQQQQPQQQQKQGGGIGQALNDPALDSPRDINGRHHRPQNNAKPYSELEDVLDARNAAGARNLAGAPGGDPGGHWMQGWFPGQPLPGGRRRSSGGSSRTAITGNLSFDQMQQQQQQGVDGGGSAVGNGSMASSPEKQAPATMVSAAMNNPPSTPMPTKQQQQQQMTGNNQAQPGACSCDRCAQMESALLSLQADLQYLRTLELQREFTCKDCDTGSVHHSTNNRLERMDSSLPPIQQNTPYHSSERSVGSAVSIGSRGSITSSRLHRRKSSDSIGGRHRNQSPNTNPNPRSIASRTSMFLRDASKRLGDLSIRHKRQVKQTTHERAYWQNDMHLKLEKFAMMCKNLNEEAAHRSNEVKETKALLDKMTSERNTLVSNVDNLKARVELYEEENVNQSKLREEWEKEKMVMLDSIDKAAKNQDGTIDDMSSRLELAVETIENERKQQRMRRQIIFPSSRPSPSQQPLQIMDTGKSSGDGSAPSSPHYRPNTQLDLASKADDLERIQRSKEVAQKAQMSLQAAMLQSASREKAMQSRLEAMERELAEARAMAAAGVGHDHSEMLVPLEMERVGMSIRRTSSTTSFGSIGPL